MESLINCGKQKYGQVSYHWYVRRNGDIIPLLSESVQGIHVKGYNWCSLGIVYEGGLDEQGHPADTRTEAQKHALIALLRALKADYPDAQKGSVLISGIEHPALREMAKNLELCGWHVITVAPDKNGFVTADAVEEKLQDDTAFVTVMAVNNETGAIQPIYEIADMLCQHGKTRRKPFFHVDCVQAAGKIELDITYRGIDSAAFSAHKLGGPRGIGLLYLAKEITPFLKGGGQERNIRSGTENLFGAQAMALCMEKYFVRKGNEQDNNVMFERMNEQRRVTAQFIEALRTIPGCTIIPHERGLSISEDFFSPWIVQAAFKGIPGQVLVRAMSADGYYISTGSACSAAKASRPILDAMQVSPEEKEDAVRFSFGASTTTQAMKDLFDETVFQSAKFVH